MDVQHVSLSPDVTSRIHDNSEQLQKVVLNNVPSKHKFQKKKKLGSSFEVNVRTLSKIDACCRPKERKLRMQSELENFDAILRASKEAHKQQLLEPFYATLVKAKRNISSVDDFNFLKIKPKVVDDRKNCKSAPAKKDLIINSNPVATRKNDAENLCLEIKMNIGTGIIGGQSSIKVFEEMFQARKDKAIIVAARQATSEGKLQNTAKHRKSQTKICTGVLNASKYIIHPPIKKVKSYFFISGLNGASLVDEFLTSLGWERTSEKWRKDCKLRWCEVKTLEYYRCFREGEQLCFQIPNNGLLTTKIGLLHTLKEYDHLMSGFRNSIPGFLKYENFFPETFRLDVEVERKRFLRTYAAEKEVWICKPAGLNQGKGICLIRSIDDLKKMEQSDVTDAEASNSSFKRFQFIQKYINYQPKGVMPRIVQRYVDDPLLLNGKKFDVRNYLLIASTKPLIAFYSDGYCRLTSIPYDRDNSDLTGHLTNQFMQKKNPRYSEVKEDLIWSMDQFNDYVNEHYAEKHNIGENWVQSVLKKRCQDIMLHCLLAVKRKLDCRLGFFDLYGCDFIIDAHFNILLLEMNCNPALYTTCEVLKNVIPTVVKESLKLTMEIFGKVVRKDPVFPLASQKKLELLYNAHAKEEPATEEKKKPQQKLRDSAKCKKRHRRSAKSAVDKVSASS